MSKVLIVYGAKSKLPRRVVVPEAGEAVAFEGHIGPGEAGVVVEADQLGHVSNARHHVAAHHGIDHTEIPSGRCAVVDDRGVVIAVLMADPEIDGHQDGKLVAHDTAEVGQTLAR